MEAIWYDSLTEVSQRLQRRELSSVELTRVMLDRIGEMDGALKAYVTLTPELALQQAAAADERLARGESQALLGVPIAVKDLCDTKGVRTGAGTRLYADRVPVSDSTVVSRLSEAGSVLLGKLKLTEGAYAEHHPDVQPPVNPWQAGRWTGVSSSGSGVATAAGLCFGSLGSDTGGSIRFPSASNGIVGLKPTWGRVSRAGVFPLADTLDHIGPMTRTVSDAALMLQVLAGADRRDPTASASPVPDYTAALDGSLAGCRIGIDETYCTAFVDSMVSEGIMEAVEVLGSAGAQIVPVTIPSVDALESGWMHTCGVEVAWAHRESFPDQAEEYGPALRQIIELGLATSAARYFEQENHRRAFKSAFDALFYEVDAVICPSMPVLPPLANERGGQQSDPGGSRPRMLRFTAPFDYAGNPTLSLPWEFVDGLPRSIQFIGSDFAESQLLRLGHALQQITSWHLHHP